MNYAAFAQNVATDYALTSAPVALFAVANGYRLRMEDNKRDLMIDPDGYSTHLCEAVSPIEGVLVWAADDSYSLVLGA